MKERRRVSATYRLQLTKEFRFADAESLVPYLHRLGISHIYASPIFAARPGSLSGYDTCDFSRINPELGGDDGFASLVRALRRHNMGIVIDFVPNHMSAHPQWNLWWRNVLANGPSSPDSEYFDIDWYPANSNLHGKVLLPILGKQYGEALESGEFRIEYREGEFCLLYGDFNLPLNPRQIKLLLRHRLHSLKDERGIDSATLQEYESILFHLDHIPGYLQAGTEARADRERETHIATRRLVALIQESSALRRHLERVTKEFNGQPGKPESFDLLHALLEQQPYRLSYWRTAMQEINYRRFFDINDLIGIRMEYQPLFHAAHVRLIELAEQGMIDGVRLDHIDGLLDPQQYLSQFRKATENSANPLYLIVEKILARQEWLNADWPVDGTTGYEYLALLNGLWVREENLRQVESIYREFREQSQPDRDVVYHAKRLITATSMASELNVLAHELNNLSEQSRRSRDNTHDGLQEALREVVACFPVYRTYISAHGFSAADEMAVNEAIGQAKRRNPNIGSSFFEFIRTHICPARQPGETEESFAQRLRFAMKFQQYTSPVQAKGMEDTVFYRHSPLASLNEVGSGTGRRATTPKEFHDANMHRLERWPDAMLTTSTHDTKHGEDARMRIHVLTEMPDEWRAKLAEWSRINECVCTPVNGQSAPDRTDEYLYYQNLLGMWPPRQREATDEIIDRMTVFMTKALKEAKVHTSWINPSNDYDAAMEKFVRETLRGECTAEFIKSFVPFAERIATFGAWNSISQIALKQASPGVVDTYQGGELWDLNLVDPDNRRPVNYETRSQRLQQLMNGIDGAKDSVARSRFVSELSAQWWTGDLKMLYLALGLRLRQQEPELLVRGNYLPLETQGPAADHIVAFARVHKNRTLLTVAARWFVSLLPNAGSLAGLQNSLRDTRIVPPTPKEALPVSGMRFQNAVTGAQYQIAGAGNAPEIQVAEILKDLPAAWLISDGEVQKTR
jgi:(1->4)-alpha-D-glucan 1-alpha-D-glucosylmutase